MSIERPSPPAATLFSEGSPTSMESGPRASGAGKTRRRGTGSGAAAQSDLFQCLFENAPDAMLMLDSRGRILLLNRSAEQMFGFDREELIGEPVGTLLPNPMRTRLRALRHPFPVAARPASACDDQEAIWARPRDGKAFPVQVMLRPVTIDASQCVLASLRDVSERMDLECDLRQAQKMETIGQLVTGVAHDFNNLLAIISGTLELVSGTLPDLEDVRDDMDTLRAACDQAAMLTRMLLAFARRSAVEPQLIELDRAIESQTPMLRRLIGEHVQVQLQLGLGPWSVRMDPTQLEQILLNLGGNSRDAMPGGGTLTISTSAVHLSATDPRLLPNMSPGPHALITVTDTGHGMDRTTLERIFDPFFTTKPVGHGTGLGLATVQGMIRQSHGNIWCESAPGHGSTFSMLLPQAEHAAEKAITVAQPERSGGRRTILLVDDDPHVLRVTRLMLERSEYQVLAAGSGAEALELITGHEAPIDLLLTDILMPQMTGPQLAERVRALRPGIPTLFASGYAESPPDGEAALRGDERVLIKPFSIRALIEAIEDALER